MLHRAKDLKDIPVEIEGVLEVSYLIFQLVVLLPEHLFHVHKININKGWLIKVRGPRVGIKLRNQAHGHRRSRGDACIPELWGGDPFLWALYVIVLHHL